MTRPRMSQVLIDLAEPLEQELGRPSDPDSFRELLRFAAAAWNLSRPGAGGEDLSGSEVLLDESPSTPGSGRALGGQALQELADRAERKHPDDPRIVVDVRVARRGRGFQVYALTEATTGSKREASPGAGTRGTSAGPDSSVEPRARAAAGPRELLERTNLSPETEPVVEQAVDELARVAESEEIDGGLRDRAGELLALHAVTDPEEMQRSRKPEVWSAGALHAAPLTSFMGAAAPGRPTLEEAARLFDVSDASVAARSRALRESWETVLEAGAHPRYPGASAGRVRLATATVTGGGPVRGEDGLWELGSERRAGALLADALALSNREDRDRAFDAERLAEAHGLTAPDRQSLAEAARRAARDHYREETGRDPAGRPQSAVLEWPDALGRLLRDILRDEVGSEEARDALARRAVAPLARPAGEPPHSVLLALARLARRGRLTGRPLAAAASLAFRDPESVAGLRTGELRPFWRALGRSDELSPTERAVGLTALARTAAAAPGPRRATELVAAVARDDEVPAEVRKRALERVAERSRSPLLPGKTTSGLRRSALVHRAELEPEPGRAAIELTEEAGEEDDEQQWRAAAEVLREHGSSVPDDRVQELVRKGLRAPKAAARQAWYQTGLELIGEDVREWAPGDVLRRQEKERKSGGSGRGGDPAQTTLF